MVRGIIVVCSLLCASTAVAQETLTVTFSTQDTGQVGWNCFNPHLAVAWLEDGSGQYVRTLKLWGRTFNYDLKDWAVSSGMDVDIGALQIDGLTGATQRCFTNLTWDYQDADSDGCGCFAAAVGNCNPSVSGSPVLAPRTAVVDISELPDATYTVRLELTQCENVEVSPPGPHDTPDATFTFDKDGTASNATPADQGAFTNVSIDYTGRNGSSQPGAWAGPDRWLAPSAASDRTVTLVGSASDDSGTFTTTWSEVSAPVGGSASIATAVQNDDLSPTTDVSFDKAGIYVLELETSDGTLQTTDEVTVYVNATRVYPEADAQVTSNNPSWRFGEVGTGCGGNKCGHQNGIGGTDSQNRNRGYARYDVSGIAGAVALAKMRIPVGWFPAYASCGTGNWRDLHVLDDSEDGWVEANINWSNQPITGPAGIPGGDDPLVGSFDPSENSSGVFPTLVDLDLDVGLTFDPSTRDNGLLSFFLRPDPSDGTPCGFGFPTRENYIKTYLLVIESWQLAVNVDPIADPGSDFTAVDLDGDGSHVVALDGTGSSDADGTVVAWDWREGGTVIGSGSQPNVTLDLGTHPIDLTVTDDAGGTGTAQVEVVVDDRYSGNDTAGVATSVTATSSGTTYDNLFAYLTGGDWFLVNLPAAGDLNISASFTHADGDLDLEVFQSDGTTSEGVSATSSDAESVALSLPAGDHLVQVRPAGGADNTYAMTIFIDTTAPVLTIDLTVTQELENSGVLSSAGTVTVDTAPSSSLDVTLTSSNPTDLSVPGTVTIAASQTSSPAFDITLADNGALDGNRVVTITATAVGHTAGSADFTVLDDESPPLAEWDAAAKTVSEEDVVTVLRTVLSKAAVGTVRVPFTVSGTATPGVDHDLTDGEITITDGQTEGSQPITITYDGVAEGDETIVVTMGTPTGASAGAITVHTITLTDPVAGDGGGTGSDGGASGGDSDRIGSNVVHAAGCGCRSGSSGRPLLVLGLGLLVVVTRRKRRAR